MYKAASPFRLRIYINNFNSFNNILRTDLHNIRKSWVIMSTVTRIWPVILKCMTSCGCFWQMNCECLSQPYTTAPPVCMKWILRFEIMIIILYSPNVYKGWESHDSAILQCSVVERYPQFYKKKWILCINSLCHSKVICQSMFLVFFLVSLLLITPTCLNPQEPFYSDHNICITIKVSQKENW